MTRTKETVTVEERREVGIVRCDGPDCASEKRVITYLREGTNAEPEPEWYTLTYGAGIAYSLMRDACSHACLLRIIQTREVAG